MIEIIVILNIIIIKTKISGGNNEKILSVLLIAVLILTLFPLTALANDPFFLEAPKNLTGKLKFGDDNLPYFELKLDIPDSLKTINANLESDSGYYEKQQFSCP